MRVLLVWWEAERLMGSWAHELKSSKVQTFRRSEVETLKSWKVERLRRWKVEKLRGWDVERFRCLNVMRRICCPIPGWVQNIEHRACNLEHWAQWSDWTAQRANLQGILNSSRQRSGWIEWRIIEFVSGAEPHKLSSSQSSNLFNQINRRSRVQAIMGSWAQEFKGSDVQTFRRSDVEKLRGWDVEKLKSWEVERFRRWKVETFWGWEG